MIYTTKVIFNNQVTGEDDELLILFDDHKRITATYNDDIFDYLELNMFYRVHIRPTQRDGFQLDFTHHGVQLYLEDDMCCMEELAGALLTVTQIICEIQKDDEQTEIKQVNLNDTKNPDYDPFKIVVLEEGKVLN